MVTEMTTRTAAQHDFTLLTLPLTSPCLRRNLGVHGGGSAVSLSSQHSIHILDIEFSSCMDHLGWRPSAGDVIRTHWLWLNLARSVLGIAVACDDTSYVHRLRMSICLLYMLSPVSSWALLATHQARNR